MALTMIYLYSMEWYEWAEYFRNMRNAKERERLEYAVNQIVELGHTCRWNEGHKCLQFEYKGSMVRFYPYKGWFTGITVKDGRGLRNLLKQINI